MLKRTDAQRSLLTHDSVEDSTCLIVGWDGNIHMRQRGVCVTESNCRDVHVGGLFDRLVISARVGHNQQPRLLKLLLNLVCESP